MAHVCRLGQATESMHVNLTQDCEPVQKKYASNTGKYSYNSPNNYDNKISFHCGRGKGPKNGSRGNYARLFCQICGKGGHIVLNCFQLMQNVSDRQSSYPTSHSSHSSMTTMAALPETLVDPNWYPDSGSTSYCIPNSDILSEKQALLGTQEIYMGNGEGLNILHTGNSVFHSPFHNKCLKLNNMLHVPKITKNLISVSKLTHGNNVYLEFFSHCLFLKDRATRAILTEEQFKDDLYAFSYKVPSRVGIGKKLSAAASSFNKAGSRNVLLADNRLAFFKVYFAKKRLG